MSSPPRLTLYVASSNPGKLREFSTTAAQAGITVQPLPSLGALPEPPETASTFTGNADLKAIAYSLAVPGLLVLADDSGLEVDALNGRPGVLSARFAESLHLNSNPANLPGVPDLSDLINLPNLSGLPKDERNNRCLLALLDTLEANAPADPPPASGLPFSRAARFVCALSVARNGQILHRAQGTVAGTVLHAPRGANGFGYDALFALHPEGPTLAELTPETKWSLSHRGNAFRTLLQQLTQ